MNDRVPFFLNDHVAARVITEETVTSSGLIVPVNVRKGNTVHAVVCHKGVECV